MSDQEQFTCYVFPTEEGKPPRAALFSVPNFFEFEEGEDVRIVKVEGREAVWSRDAGAWVSEGGLPLPQPVSDMITEHAKALGVEEFLDG